MGASVEMGIHVEVIGFDVHMMRVSFKCANGYFSGQGEIYADHKWPAKLAEAMKGFPRNPTDSRQLGLGKVDTDCMADGVHMSFYCLDSAGHAVVETKLHGGASLKSGELESVALRIPIEPASVDELVRQLEQIDLEIGSSASCVVRSD